MTALNNTLYGYKRSIGIGFRNHVLVLPMTGCQSDIARRIASRVSGATCLAHVNGCDLQGDDFDLLGIMLERFATHPNIGGVLLLAMGCAATLSYHLPQKIRESGRLIETLNTQNAGTTATVDAGVKIVSSMVQTLSTLKRKAVGFESLIIGTKCGASDANSFTRCHPVVGRACDMLVERGATVVLSENCELVASAHLLADRAANESIAVKIRALPDEVNSGWKRRFGHSLEDLVLKRMTREAWTAKSLQHAEKAGSGMINGFFEMEEKLHGPGLVILNGPNTDLESVTALAASGCNMTFFTTGRGTPVGSPAAITLKITATQTTYEKMAENIDLCVAENGESIDAAAERIVASVINAANGTSAKAEILGHWEVAMPIRGVTY